MNPSLFLSSYGSNKFQNGKSIEITNINSIKEEDIIIQNVINPRKLHIINSLKFKSLIGYPQGPPLLFPFKYNDKYNIKNYSK